MQRLLQVLERSGEVRARQQNQTVLVPSLLSVQLIHPTQVQTHQLSPSTTVKNGSCHPIQTFQQGGQVSRGPCCAAMRVVCHCSTWDGIHCWYWCCHRSKVCSKAHRLPSAALPPLWSAGLFQKANSPTVTCVQTNSHRPERPTILQYSDFQNVVARVHRRRKLLEIDFSGEFDLQYS